MKKYPVIRRLLVLIAITVAFGLVVPAQAAFTGGNCNLSGATSGAVCFFRVFPRTTDNGKYTTSDSNMHNEFYPFSGESVGDSNKDNVNGESYTVEICKNTNYSGGAQIVLSPNTGWVAGTPQGSSFRALTNTCNN